MTDAPQAVVFDVGKVLFEWDLRHLYAKLIDDSPHNIEAAARRGWQTHLFTDAGRLEAELVERGLLA